MEKASHNSCADVEIKFNSQSQAILSPDGQQRLLPCDGNCNRVVWVSLNTVSTLCEDCVKVLEDEDRPSDIRSSDVHRRYMAGESHLTGWE
jgi:hypothetical protein